LILVANIHSLKTFFMRKIYFSGLMIVTFCFVFVESWSQAPIIGSPATNATIDCTATPVFTAPTAGGGCGGVTVNLLSQTTTGTSCNKIFTRSWDATDACGSHSATVSQSIVVVDFTPPTISQVGVNATIDCTATPFFTPPTSSDDCNGSTVSLLSFTNAGNACTKVMTRQWDATDACGNHSVTRTQTITVANTQSPTIGPAGPNATIICGTLPVFTPPTASDNCGGVTVNETTVTTGQGCVQTIRKMWFAVDACGRSSDTVSETITIRPFIVNGTLLLRVPIDFLHIADAVQYLDGTGITLPTVIELQQGYTSFIPTVIDNIPGNSPTNTLTIRPAADATGLVIGSPQPVFDPNSLTYFLPPPTLVTMDLQNASNVIIDGRPGGIGTQSQLTIQNFSVAGNAVRFVYGANNNCIKYCTLEGVNAASTYTNSPAVVLYDAGGTKSDPNATGVLIIKDNIQNCVIRGVGGTVPVVNGIYSSGINNLNGNNVISNNGIADFTSAGILVSPVGNGGNWTITGNSFYYDLPSPATTNQTAIQFIPGASSDDNIISGNFIGGTAANAGGGAWMNTGTNGSASFAGIVVDAGTTNGAEVHNNTIQNISIPTTDDADFTGLVVDRLAGNNGNIVGSPTTANSIQVSANNASATGIFVNSDYPVSVKNDKICNISVSGGTTVLMGIRKAGGTPTEAGKNNVFNLSATNGTATGIQDEGTGDMTISENNIKNISGSTASDIKITKPTDVSTDKVFDNTLSGDASSTGISVDVQNSAVLTLSVENNVIAGFSKGIVLSKSSGATLNTSIFDNAITANTTGIDNESGTPTNATCNWWGSANGPAAGQIIGNVIYSPWATISQYVSVNAGADQTIYVGYGPQSATLTATTVACGTPQYLWSTGAVSPSIVVSPAATTKYFVTVTDAGGHQASDTVVVSVINSICGNNNDKVLMCHKGITICIKQADVPDHLKQGDQLGSCPIGPLTQARTTGEENFSDHQLMTYPNPAKNNLEMRWFAEEAGMQLLQVFDLTGRKIREEKIIQSKGINNKELDLGELTNGTYLLKMAIGKEIKTTTFIIRK
jgi:hypothetical protein